MELGSILRTPLLNLVLRGLYWEPGTLLLLQLLLLLFGLASAFFAWTFGYVRTARALAVLTSIALLLTSLGVALLLLLVLGIEDLRSGAHGLGGYVLAGLFEDVQLRAGTRLEACGAVWTLALGLVGLRRSTTGRRWAAALLLVGLVPLLGAVVAQLFSDALQNLLRQRLGPDILGLTPLGARLGVTAPAPLVLVAALVTTTYAVAAAVRACRSSRSSIWSGCSGIGSLRRRRARIVRSG